MNQTGIMVVLGQYKCKKKKMDPAPLYWRVLEIKNGEALILCDTLVEYLPYHVKEEGSAWKGSSLRKWLNNDFIKTAFRAEEFALIKDNPLSDEPETRDWMFILSKEEVEKYLSGEVVRRVDGIQEKPARVALKLVGPRGKSDEYWWLRSGIDHIDHNGFYGFTPPYCERWVRPACWINWSDFLTRYLPQG